MTLANGAQPLGERVDGGGARAAQAMAARIGAIAASVAWGPQERPLIYICGPTSLVEAMASLLQAQGHAPERLKTERFGPTGN